MSERPFISVVIPAFNEEENVGILYERLKPVLDRESSRYEILFVDDGSTDETSKRISELREKDSCVKLIELSRNFGHQAALTAGIDHVTGDVCITMDADLQHPPEALPQLLEKHREGFDVVSGVKTGPRRRSLVMELIARIYYFLLRTISHIPIDPHASDFRLMDRKVVEALQSTRESARFLRGLVKWIGFRSTTLPYEPAQRLKGRPTYTLRRRMEVGMAGVFSFSIVPLRLGTFVGIGVALLATAGALFALIERISTGRPIDNVTVLLIVVLFLGGLNLTFLGIVGEYLGRVFLEVKKRPLYVIRSRVGLDT